MKPPWAYEESRRTAPIHVQLMLLRRTRLEPGQIHARIVRIFRDRTGTLYFGKRLRFSVPVIDRVRSGPVEPGGTIYHDWDRLISAKWFEAFLERYENRFHLVESQIAPIRRPTFRPVCGPETKGFVCEGNIGSGRSGP